MNIHIILSSDARFYLGLKSGELKQVSEIPKNTHWYGVWRMDLWPNDLAALPEQTDSSPLILVNKATRFALLKMDQPVGFEDFKGNLAGYLQWPLHLGMLSDGIIRLNENSLLSRRKMKPYNPLEKENLGKSVAESLLSSKSLPLGQIDQFNGAGVYSIYYLGDFEAYAPLKKWNSGPVDLSLPIYVGKAIPTGGRKGIIDPEVAGKDTSLFKRLADHRKSIEAVENLEIEDFHCRFLIVDDIWIPLGESLLIQRYRPLWNPVVDGFGNHDPGAGHYKGARPSWDAIHPGRPWAEKCSPSKLTNEAIIERISAHWEACDFEVNL